MTIREKGYHQWDGQLLVPRFRWFPIFLNGIKMVFNKRWSKALFTFTASPFLGFLVAVFASTRPELKMFPGLQKMLTYEAGFFREFAANGFIVFMLVMLGVFFGAELISGDIKFNSFPLYFSRPLDRKDYILGKFSIVMFFFLLLTLVPNILLYAFKFIFTGQAAIASLPPLILVPILLSFFIASITLMASSLSGNTRFVKVIIFVTYILSDILAHIFVRVFGNDYWHLISIKSTVKQVGAFLFNTDPQFDYLPWLSLVVLIVLSAGSFLILYKRIGRAEAQIETGN